MADLSKNADHVVVTDAVTRLADLCIWLICLLRMLICYRLICILLKKCMFYLMGDVITKSSDLSD